MTYDQIRNDFLRTVGAAFPAVADGLVQIARAVKFHSPPRPIDYSSELSSIASALFRIGDKLGACSDSLERVAEKISEAGSE